MLEPCASVLVCRRRIELGNAATYRMSRSIVGYSESIRVILGTLNVDPEGGAPSCGFGVSLCEERLSPERVFKLTRVAT